MSIVKDLCDYVRARYPILYLVSSEENRALENLSKVAEQTGKGFWVWSVSDGLINPQGKEIMDNEGKPMCSPLKALRYINRSQEKALFVFKDLHLFLEDPFPQYVTDPLQVRRVLRDIAISFRTSFKSLIILSPILKIPTELEKDISVFDFPLPTQEEISAILDSTVQEVIKVHGDKVKVDLTADDRDRIIKSVSGLTVSEIENVFKPCHCKRS